MANYMSINLLGFVERNNERRLEGAQIQEDLSKGFSTKTVFWMLHEKNLEFRTNIRGLVNYKYNRLLEGEKLIENQIPGGEDIERLGLDQLTPLVRPDLYFQAYNKVLSDFNDRQPIKLPISTRNFFSLLHGANLKYSANVRGLINRRYNELLDDNERKIPNNHDLDSLGMDQATAIDYPDLYFKAYGEILSKFEKAYLRRNESWESDKHFQLADIEKLAKRRLGLRHVSSDNQVWDEWAHGVKYGCSFNLTFQRSEHDYERGFETLPPEIANPDIPEYVKLEGIKQYEEAVNGHIGESLGYDLTRFPLILGRTTVGQICDFIYETRFTVIEYNYGMPTDFSQYRGLGRFPKTHIPREQLRGMLFFFDSSRIGPINLRERIETVDQLNHLMQRIKEWFRINLINHLRSQVYDWKETS